MVPKASAPCRTPAAKLFKDGDREYTDARPLAGGRRARTTPPTSPSRVSMEILSEARPCSKAKAPRSASPCARSIPTAPTATSRASALFLTNNDTSAKIDRRRASSPPASAARRSSWRASTTFTVGSQVIVIPKDLQVRVAERSRRTTTSTRSSPTNSRSCASTPSELCSDEVFLRRAFLDIVGVAADRARSTNRFIADTDPKKRDKLVDELLGRKEFVELWVMKWAELLQIRSDGNSADQLQGHAALLQLAARAAREERADEQDRAGAALGDRRHVQEPGDQLLPDRAATR